MNINNSFKILKKLNIIKSYLISEDDISNSIIEVIDELFNDESNNEIEQIRLELEKGNKIKSLNILNNYKESISKILFQNPCSKKWYELIETDDYKIKYCTDCSKNVFLVETEDEMIKRRNLEQCIAVNTVDFNIKSEKYNNFKACHINFSENYLIGSPPTYTEDNESNK